VKKPRKADFYRTMLYKMEHASAVCEKHGDPAVLMRFAIDAIRRERDQLLADDRRELPGYPWHLRESSYRRRRSTNLFPTARHTSFGR
jgi:hypothetical protein